MIHYARQQERCRSLVLLDYFGEISDSTCGICDICLRNKKLNEENQSRKIQKEILSQIQSGAQHIDSIIEKIGSGKKDEIIEIIRQMLESGEIEFRDMHYISLKK
jgi:ATP-dependent DNA helicase RecQ